MQIPAGYHLIKRANRPFPIDPNSSEGQEKLQLKSQLELRIKYVTILKPYQKEAPPEFFWIIPSSPNMQQIEVQLLNYFHKDINYMDFVDVGLENIPADHNGLPLFDLRWLRHMQARSVPREQIMNNKPTTNYNAKKMDQKPSQIEDHQQDQSTKRRRSMETLEEIPSFKVPFSPISKPPAQPLPHSVPQISLHKNKRKFSKLPEGLTVDVSCALWRSLHELRVLTLAYRGINYFENESKSFISTSFSIGQLVLFKAVFNAFFVSENFIVERTPALVTAEKLTNNKFKMILYDTIKSEYGRVLYLQCTHFLIESIAPPQYIINLQSQVLEKQNILIRTDGLWPKMYDMRHSQLPPINKSQRFEALEGIMQQHEVNLNTLLMFFHHLFPYERPVFISPLNRLKESNLL